jgi:hypothetical protein
MQRRLPTAKLASVTRGHRHPTKRAQSSRIVIGFGQSPSVPGLGQKVDVFDVLEVDQMGRPGK